MPRRRINGISLYHEVGGSGEPVVLVHGSWTDHTTWRFVVPTFARHHTVVTYDRRGHSRTERVGGPVTRRTDEDDLVALVEALDLGPVHLVGTSYGGSIALGTAARRPDLVRTVVAHEPPLLGVAAADGPLHDLAPRVWTTMREVAATIADGGAAPAAERFVDELVLGPGAWRELPDEVRSTMVANAHTFVATMLDPAWAEPPAAADVPVLLTDGDRSPRWLPLVVEVLAATSQRAASRHTFTGAGHAPHLTHPDEHVDVAIGFLAAAGRPVPPDRAARAGAGRAPSHQDEA